MWATKYFRFYLYEKKFLVRTYHASLKFLPNFADHNSPLMPWSLLLPEFNFEIEHVPGNKIKHVAALSRHVGMVEDTQLMSKELMLMDQRRLHFVNSR